MNSSATVAADHAQAAAANKSVVEASSSRLMSLDVLRGMDMFFIIGMEEFFHALSEMIPMGPPTLIQTLDHAKWEGFHFYDLIFPLFAFIIGVSLTFSLSKAIATEGKMGATIKVLKRGFILLFLGIIFYQGIANGLDRVRLMGVLQRLAICSMGAGLAFIWLNTRGLIALTISLLVGYWALLTFVPVPGFGAGDFAEGHNLANWVDKMFLPFRKWDGDHDPEGLLSNLPAIANTLLGVFAGLLLRNTAVEPSRKTRLLLIWGAAGIVAGLLWHLQFPIIKKIWTSSFVLFTCGISAMLLALCYHIVDVKNHRRWCTVFLWIGTNAITIFLINNVVDFVAIARRFTGGEIKIMFDEFHHGLGNVITTFLALIFALLVCRFFYRRKIFLRI